MSWARHAQEALLRGETVQVRPRGHSMKGKVSSGDLVTLEPCDISTLRVGVTMRYAHFAPEAERPAIRRLQCSLSPPAGGMVGN